MLRTLDADRKSNFQTILLHHARTCCYRISIYTVARAFVITFVSHIKSTLRFQFYQSVIIENTLPFFFSLSPFIFYHSFFFAISNTCNFVDFKNDYVSVTILKWNRRIDIPIFYTNFTFNVLESLRYILRITHSHVKEKFLCNVVIRELIEHESPSFRFF